MSMGGKFYDKVHNIFKLFITARAIYEKYYADYIKQRSASFVIVRLGRSLSLIFVK